MTSICSLIYRSTRYADAVWRSAHSHTPELRDGRARFFFVANDATPEVIDHLRREGYAFVENVNQRIGHDRLLELGFDPPEYIRRVYQGWNRALDESDETLVLVNSDCMFSPGWFGNLLRHLTPKTVVSSKLVERRHPRHGVFPLAIEHDFGTHPDSFQEQQFVCFADRASIAHTHPGGAFMPVAMHKPAFRYPEGNPRGDYGDRVFFSKLAAAGVQHVTAQDSIVYHFKEGEMDE
jgi:hypothetical protein